MRARRLHVLIPLLAGLAFAAPACDDASSTTAPPVTPVTPTTPGAGPPIDRAIFPLVGATEFTSANEDEQLSAGTGTSYNRGEAGYASFGDADSDAAAGAAENAPPEAMPEPDPTREVVEADIFKLDGDHLYVMNAYRGLLILDVTDPDAPHALGRLPFQATPVDMYVRDGRAYIVMSDYFSYWQFDPDADPLGFHGSQVLIVDVSDPTAPVALGSFPLEGEVTDTRMVGDVLYAVSKRNPDYWRYNTADWEDRTWVASLNVANPHNIQEIERLTFAGTSTLIHVAPHAIFVAAQDPNYYLVGDGYEQETLVTYIDISDPKGRLRQRGSVYVPGFIADKFKLDYHDKTLRVFSQRWYGSSDGWLATVDVSFPDALTVLAQLEINDDDFGYLRATRFDGARAYAMTTRWVPNTNIRELHTFDLADPALPALAATRAIDTDISHFETRGDRLLALGRTYGYSSSRVQITLYDVADLAAPTVLSKVLLGSNYAWSEAIGDYKAFRVVDELGLILIPLSYWTGSTHFDGTQLVDWTGDALAERGQIGGVSRVRRAFPVKDRLVAFSERQLQVIDAADRDHPTVTAEVYFIRNVLDVFAIDGRQVQLVGDVEEGGFFFEVLPFGPDDDAPALARLDLPFTSAPYCVREGDALHLIGYEPGLGQLIRNADFANVLAPTLRGELLLSAEAGSIYTPGYSFYNYYWVPQAGLPLAGRIIPFTERHIVELPTGRREWQSALRFIDLGDLDAPRIADGSVPMNDYPFINKMTHGHVLYSTHVEAATTPGGETLLYHVKSFVDRIDVSDPDAPVVLPSLNVPGMLVDASLDHQLLYTIDYQWDAFGRRRNSLNVLRVAGDQAVLLEVIPVSDQVNRAVFRDRTVWLVSHKYPWWGVGTDTVDSRQPYTALNTYRFALSGTLASHATAKVPGYHFDLLDVEGSRVYLASRSPYGLLILDASDPTAPETLHSARSIGYISRIVNHASYTYTPLGWYGVHRTQTGL